jgi:hypothetical protein
VNCLTHTENDQGDQIAVFPPNKSFQFLAGADNPVAEAAGKNVLVSDSLVTVPVFDGGISATNSAQIIGFVQLFMNWDGTGTYEMATGRQPFRGDSADAIHDAILRVLLQLRVLCPGLFQDRNVQIGVFPEGKEVLVRSTCPRRISL